MTSSLGCEHQKPRVSTMMLASKGTIKSVTNPGSVATGGGGSGGGYSSRSLIGNFYEDRFDSRFADGKTVLPTALEQSWRTTYHGMVGRPGWNGQAAVDRSALSCSTTQKPGQPLGHLTPLDPATQLSRETMDLLVSLEAAVASGHGGRHDIDTSPLRSSIGSKRDVTQQELAEIAAGRNRAFPGHQPERDLPAKDPISEQQQRFKTEQRRSFDDPEDRRQKIQTNAVDLFHGKANDKAHFVIFKLNVELQQRMAPIGQKSQSEILGLTSSASFASSYNSNNNNNNNSPLSASTTSNISARGGGGGGENTKSLAQERQERFRNSNLSTIPVLSSVKPACTVAFTGTAEVHLITSFSYCGLRRALDKVALLDGKPTLNLAELKQGLNYYGVTKLGDDEFAVLFKHFDPTGTGQVDLNKFVAGIRGHMNERRKAVVVLAFQLVISTVRRLNNTDCVRFGDIINLFDAAHHPDVVGAKKSSEDFVRRHVFEDYYVLDNAADRAAMEDTPVTEAMFCDIFEDWSGLVNADFHFEATVRSCYHLTGGEGLSRCVSNLKVEVIHTNGRITQQIIRDDLAVHADDNELILQFLERQGIKDVKRFRVLNA